MNAIVGEICSTVSEERLVGVLQALGLGHLQGKLVAVRQAICGQPGAALWLEREAQKANGCACKGHAVQAVAQMVAGDTVRLQRAGQSVAALSRPIPQGQSGLGQGDAVPTGRESLDWNCRKDRGDETWCSIRRITNRKYPVVNATTANDSLLMLTTAAERATWELDELPPGEAWYLFLIPPAVLRLDRVSQVLGLYGWTFVIDGEAQSPEQVLLAAERIYLRNGEVVHALQPWFDIPNEGYKIEKGRCRCAPMQVVCIPLDGRLAIVMSGPEAETVATLSVTWQRIEVQKECGPCPPEEFCDTPLLPATTCVPVKDDCDEECDDDCSEACA